MRIPLKDAEHDWIELQQQVVKKTALLYALNGPRFPQDGQLIDLTVRTLLQSMFQKNPNEAPILWDPVSDAIYETYGPTESLLLATCAQKLRPELLKSHIEKTLMEVTPQGILAAQFVSDNDITPETLLNSIATVKSGFLTGDMSVSLHRGLTQPEQKPWADFLVPTNSIEAAGLLTLILHTPVIEVYATAVTLASRIKPFLDSPEVSQVISHFSNWLFDDQGVPNFPMTMQAVVGYLMYASLLDVPELTPSLEQFMVPHQDPRTFFLDEQDLPENYLTALEREMGDTAGTQMFEDLLYRKVRHLPVVHRSVVESTKRSSPDLRIDCIIASLQ